MIVDSGQLIAPEERVAPPIKMRNSPRGPCRTERSCVIIAQGSVSDKTGLTMVPCPARLIAWFEGQWTNLLVKKSFDYYPVGESEKIYHPSLKTLPILPT